MQPCLKCGFETARACPRCEAPWETWDLQFAPIPLEGVRDQVVAWLGRLPAPAMFEWLATENGLKLRLYTPAGQTGAALDGWAAMTSQQTRWKRVGETVINEGTHPFTRGLVTDALLPAALESEGDPILALGSKLLSMRAGRGEEQVPSLRMWILGKETVMQDRLRALSAYNYGAETGVDDDTPNPWSLRLSLLRSLLGFGAVVAAISGAAIGPGWVSAGVGGIGAVSGLLIFLAAYLGIRNWMRWRSIPKDQIERALEGALLQVAFTTTFASPESLELLAGSSRWAELRDTYVWPGVKRLAIPVPAGAAAGLIAPPESGEGAGIVARESRQDVPTPPPSPALLNAAFKIGTAAATGEAIGIDPDRHALITGGSGTGKSSFVYRMLKQLIEQGDEAPGLFLLDPHLSLADGLLQAIDDLPEPHRSKAIGRLRIITPDQPEVVPLNLLALPNFNWAGNSLIMAGKRIWSDYWGPRMQAALLGLSRLIHAKNMQRPESAMGLMHVPFAAFNTDWRHEALSFMPPEARAEALALDILLGQTRGGGNERWATEVISPVLSKAMAISLSPWLYSAMHQASFVDMETWVREKAWVIGRLPVGEMGADGVQLTAGMIYNVFEAVFRKVAEQQRTPFYFIIDETQEIAAGMRLEAMLAEGGKFGARLFVLVQSLSSLRRIEGFDAVVQSLLANTSTQAFFAPDPEDADLIRATLSSTVRYGDTTLDVPTLNCWLRARLQGQWQPPTLARVEPLQPSDPARVQAVIREAIATHPEDYVLAERADHQIVEGLREILPFNMRGLLDALLVPKSRTAPSAKKPEGVGPADPRAEAAAKAARLGWQNNMRIANYAYHNTQSLRKWGRRSTND